MEIIIKKISELIPATYNPREITDEEFEKLKNSLKEFGFVEPIIINKKGTIIGGHMRVKAAEAIGIKEVPCTVVTLSDRKEKLLNLALNRISGRWDTDKLSNLITELTAGGTDVGLSGFENWELDIYNIGPDNENTSGIKNSNKEVDINGLGNDLDVECPRCHFKFSNED